MEYTETSRYLALDQKGYSKRLEDKRACHHIVKDTSRTQGSMAPEVMCREYHGAAVDYFAIGVKGLEFMKSMRLY